MERLRVATLQYFIRPVDSFDEFAAQVSGLVETAADYKCQLLVFPEYFTIQLLTLGDVKASVPAQVRQLSQHVPRFTELMSDLARRWKVYIVAGSIPVMEPNDHDRVYNECFVFGPRGEHVVQGKLHMTRWEREAWDVSPRRGLNIIETDFGRVAVNICYDVEFPEIARQAARLGANMLIVPSCTDDRQGLLRVRYCCQARAIENNMYVVMSSTVGSLPNVPAVSLNYGQAAILTPSDFPFSRDGILAEGVVNQETMVIGDLNMKTILQSHTDGTVLPLHDSKNTAELIANPQVTRL